jgi:hypothetical protein
MGRVATSSMIFMAGAFAGPLLSWATKPDFHLDSVIYGFLFDLIILIWPTIILGVSMPEGVPIENVIISVGANVLFLGLVGAAIGFALSRPVVLVGIYLVLTTLIGLFAAWTSGFDLRYFDFFAFAITLGFYAFLFWLSVRLAMPRPRSQAE